MIESDLLQLKKKVDKAKATVAELTGQKNAEMKNLKTEWGCLNLESAELLIKEKNRKKDKLNQQIETGLVELEEKFNLFEE